MQTNKLISSLCYFSIFFAGFILPIIVYFVVDDREVKNHAKSAFFSHLIPLFSVVLVFLPLFFIWSIEAASFMIFLVIALLALINIGVVIWNVVKGIKVLAE